MHGKPSLKHAYTTKDVTKCCSELVADASSIKTTVSSFKLPPNAEEEPADLEDPMEGSHYGHFHHFEESADDDADCQEDAEEEDEVIVQAIDTSIKINGLFDDDQNQDCIWT